MNTKAFTTHVSTTKKHQQIFSDLSDVVILIESQQEVSDTSPTPHCIPLWKRIVIITTVDKPSFQKLKSTKLYHTIMMRLSKTTRMALILAAALLACLSMETESFSTCAPLSLSRQGQRPSLLVVQKSTDEESSAEEPAEKMSLEEKMKSWEASEEELKAATLGGVIPQSRERTGAFDVGLYIAFPIMVLTGLAFAFFPFIMENIDVSDIVVPTE